MFILNRDQHNPLLSPERKHTWEAHATFNPSPVMKDDIVHLLYRSIGHPDPLVSPHDGMSTISKAVSPDGTHFHSRRPFITPQEEWDKFGCEDPRVTYFEKRYYTFYTAISSMPPHAGSIKVGVAISDDLEQVTERHLVTPFNAKAMGLFPKRINGKVTAILTAHTDEPPSKIAIAQFKNVDDLWDEEKWNTWHEDIDAHTIDIPRRSPEDHVEVGAPPVLTSKGWLLIYSYIQNYSNDEETIFGIEALLLDKKDPRKIIGQSHGPIMVPEESYELYGSVRNITFPSGVILHKDKTLDIYYGGADTVCARASLYLPDLLKTMTDKGRRSLVTRHKKNPILSPREDHAWESRTVFNPAAVDCGGDIHLVYRAMSEDNTSVFGYARLPDGINVKERLDEPIYTPREEFEMKKGSPTGNSGCEDPRITQIGKKLYMTYTAYDGVSPTRVALSHISEKDFLKKRFEKWSTPVLVTPDGVTDKNMCLFPKKIGGQYMMLHRIDQNICADLLDDLDFSDGRVARCIELIGPRTGMWDSAKVGITGPPVETKDGWLLIYHGVSESTTYRLGAVLLDKNDPTTVLARTVDPIFEPLEPYELEGEVPNVVFSCGWILRDDTIYLYYGGADKVIGVATLSCKELLSLLTPPLST